VTNPAGLRIYLNDHLAGSISGIELAKRSLSNNRDTPLGQFLLKLLKEIEADRASLERIMSRLGVSKDPVKQAVGWLAEKAGRLKLNGQLLGYSDLSRVVELEGLSLGVEGKLAMWRTCWRSPHRSPDSIQRSSASWSGEPGRSEPGWNGSGCALLPWPLVSQSPAWGGSGGRAGEVLVEARRQFHRDGVSTAPT
jgi:hypothetical protein